MAIVTAQDYPVERLPEEVRGGLASGTRVEVSLRSVLAEDERFSFEELFRLTPTGLMKSDTDVQAYFDELRGPHPVD